MALMHTPEVNSKMSCPEFILPSVDGKVFRTQDFANGLPLVVMFICNHCPYVKAIEDRLIQLGHDLKKLKVHLVAICSNDGESYPEDSLENLRQRAQEKSFSFVYLHDKSQSVAQSFGAVCTPDFFVFDQDRKLSYRGRLDDSWKDPQQVTRRDLYNHVKALVEGASPASEQISSMGCSIKWVKP